MINFITLISNFFSTKSKDVNNNDLTTLSRKEIMHNEENISDSKIVDKIEEEKKYYNLDNDGVVYKDKQRIKIPNTNYVVNYNNIGEWINFYDENGIRYGFVLQPYDTPSELIGTFGCIKWAKNTKPKDYKKIENFFANEKFTLPYDLTDNEKTEIKKIIENYYSSKIENISFNNSEFVNTPNSLFYDIVIDYADSFSGEYFHIEITKSSIGSFKTYDIEYPIIFIIREKSELEIAKRNKLKILNVLFEEKWKREKILIEQQKKIDEEEKIKKDIKKDIEENYLKTKNALKTFNVPFSVTVFYKLMTNRKYVTKDGPKYSTKYIPINDGIKYAKSYGIFYLKKSTLKELLEILIKDYEKLKLEKNETSKNKIKVIHQLHRDIDNTIIYCTKCNSDHLNKKGKRELQNKVVQRYQCQNCNHMFTKPIEIH